MRHLFQKCAELTVSLSMRITVQKHTSHNCVTRSYLFFVQTGT